MIIEQRLLDRRHESSSVGARPSSAAPVEQYPDEWVELALLRLQFARVLFDGGGRGRPRSDRRAFLSPVAELLFDGAAEGHIRQTQSLSDTKLSNSSGERGQSFFNNCDNARSANSLPPV